MPLAKNDNLTLDAIESALSAISADVSRERWARIGMALKSELGDREGFDLFDAWSKTGQGYDAKNCRDTWKSIRPDGGVNIGTLIFEAQQNGWAFDDNRATLTAEAVEARRVQREAERRAGAAERRRQQGEAAKLANLTWTNAQAAADDHPYLVSKGVRAHGLCVGTWPWVRDDGTTSGGQAGTLLVPIMDAANGKIISLQGIVVRPDGSFQKRYLKNGRKRGGCHMIGNPPAAGEPLAFCEGYATGATIHALTGWAVVVTFDAPNLPVVADTMREKFPHAAFIICGDNDRWSKLGDIENPGLHYAERAAQVNRGFLIAPEFASLEGEPTDFNDLAEREGEAAVRAQLLNNPVTGPARYDCGERAGQITSKRQCGLL